MYTIESVGWEEVKDFWETNRTYNLTNPEPIIKIDKIDKIWIDPVNIFTPQIEKTIVIKKDNDLIGVLQIQDFSTIHPPLRVAGIKNVAVPHALRSNGIGTKLMEIADLYLRFLRYDLSMLYSSLYANQYRFYEIFGYERYDEEFVFDRTRKVHLKFYNNIGLTTPELNQLIKDAGKF